MAVPVPTEKQVQALLRKAGFEPTENHTATGTYWRCAETGKHVQVPFSVEGYYPDWLLADLVGIIGRVDPWALRKLNPQ